METTVIDELTEELLANQDKVPVIWRLPGAAHPAGPGHRSGALAAGWTNHAHYGSREPIT